MPDSAQTPFPLSPDGYIQHWMASGLFAGLLMPHRLPAEGDLTAGEPWHLAFARYRRIQVPGFRGQEGHWWLGCCAVRTTSEAMYEVTLEVTGAPGVMVGLAGEDFRSAAQPRTIHLDPLPHLIIVAIPVLSHPQTFAARLVGMPVDEVEVLHILQAAHPLRLGRARGRDIWIDSGGEPCPTIWAELLNVSPGRITDLRFSLSTGHREIQLHARGTLEAREADLFEIPYPDDLDVTRAVLIASGGGATVEAEVTLPRTTYDWEVHFVSHFHFDPVWWNTQSRYLEAADNSAFRLLGRYLDACEDPDFSFVLEQVPCIKPFWDTFPARREEIKRLISSSRIGVVGALYLESQTTLLGPEANARAVTYGTLYSRRQLGATRLDGWMLDVFGHDPNFPQFLARAGCSTVAYARGPYKRCWGIPAARLGFPVDHWWMAPDGSRVLARLLEPIGYALGNSLRRYDSPEEAWWETSELFEAAASFTASHLEIWTIGADFSDPIPWVPELARQWNATHLSPKMQCSTPAQFFDALLEEVREETANLPLLTRDMNPVNNGAGVSYIDTKLAGRLCERLLFSAEALSTLASLAAGRPYPSADLDLAWRQLLFGSHHDALTGTESDQVYLDLLGGWREAYEAASRAITSATAALVEPTGDRIGEADLTVLNPLPWRRDGVIEVELPPGWDAREATVYDGATPLPAEVLTDRRQPVLRFVARSLPALGAKVFRVTPDAPPSAPDLTAGTLSIENEFFRLAVDPLAGGGIVSLFDKVSGRELVAEGRVANDLVAHKEYPELPGYGEGPWNLAPTGEKHSASAEFPAEVSAEHTPTRLTLVARSDHVESNRLLRVTLWTGLPRVDFETHVFDYTGRDWLFKTHFPLAITGGRPLFEVAGPVVSRTYCAEDADSRHSPWSQDSSANNFVDLSVPLLLEASVGIGGDILARLSVGMGEIVCPSNVSMADDSAVGQLLLALSSVGVTASVSFPQYRRFGDIAWDSNVPDFRLLLGGPDDNEFTRHVLEGAGEAVANELRDWVWRHGWAVALLPRLKLGLPAELPILIVWGQTVDSEVEALEHVTAQIRQLRKIGCLIPSSLRDSAPAGRPHSGGVALLNRGTVTHCCYPDQTLTLSLLRSCSGWPSGVWMDEPQRALPDGSGFQLEHWGHVFHYSLLAHQGHWKDSSLARAGLEYNRPPLPIWGRPSSIDPGLDLCSLEPASVVATALKPSGASVGHPLDRAPGRSLVLRLQETSGEATEARLRLAMPVAAAWKCDLLEEPSTELTVSSGEIVVPLGQFETATVILSLDPASTDLPVAPTSFAEPFYARWWRYNRGAEPTGWVPAVALFDADAPLHVEPGQALAPTVTLSAGYLAEPCPAKLTIEAPDGWLLETPARDVLLQPNGFEERKLGLSIPPDAPRGQYVVVAHLSTPHAPPSFDVLHLSVTDSPGPLVEARLETSEVDLRDPKATVRVRVRNLSLSSLSGQAILISPVEAWTTHDAAARPISLGPGAEQLLEWPLHLPAKELHGWLWAMAKVMVGDTLLYTDTARLTL